MLGRENYHSKVGMVIFSYYEAEVEKFSCFTQWTPFAQQCK